jgi:aminopeptidase N
VKNLPTAPVLLMIIPVLWITSCHPIDEEKYFEEGVSKLLATYRNATVKNVSYKLSFSIPEGKDAPIEGEVVIDFALTSKREPVIIDFGTREFFIAEEWRSD